MFKNYSKKLLTERADSEMVMAHTEQKIQNMRTKSMILGAAVLAAGVASSMASSVYSVNVVGYVNLTVYPGFNMLGNQLDVDGVDKIGTVLNAANPNPAGIDGLELLTFVNGNYKQDFYDGTGNTVGFVGWYDGQTGNPSTNTIQPGKGFFINNPYSSNIVLTVAGTVLQGTNSVNVSPGFTLMSTVVPTAVTLDTTATNNFPAEDGMEYLQYTNVGHGGNYAVADFYDGTGNTVGFIGWYNGQNGQPVSPTPAVGTGFYINAPTATNWSRFFQVQ